MRIRLLFILFLTAVSCSSKKSQQGVIPPGTLEVLDRESAKITLDNAEVICENGVCPESVGAFYMYHSPKKVKNGKEHQIKLCSITLISSNRILTNKHCIEDVIKAGESFSEDIFAKIKFPAANGKPFSSYDCKKVISTSEEYPIKDKLTQKMKRRRQVPDWAIIELTEHVKDRAPITTVAKGIDTDNLAVSLYPVYFDLNPKSSRGVLQHVTCTRTFNNGGLYIFSQNGDGPLMKLENCSQNIISGNSGSGVFVNNSSQLLGLIATSKDTNAHGTVAQCVGDFSSAESQCIFPDEKEFFDTMKTMSFMGRLLKSIKNNAQVMSPENDVDGLEYFMAGDLDQYQKVKSSLKPFWETPSLYLKDSGSDSFAHHYVMGFTRAVLPRVPKCFSKDLSGKIQLRLVDFNSWKKIFEYDWEETIETDSEGREVSLVREVTVPSIQYGARTVRFDIVQENNEKILRASSDLPDPLHSLEIRIPSCH